MPYSHVIAFYHERFGVYPHRSLTIVPGMSSISGGYPAATALVVVHGQEQLAERPEAFRQWMTWIRRTRLGTCTGATMSWRKGRTRSHG